MDKAPKLSQPTRMDFLIYLDSIDGRAEFMDGHIQNMSGGTPNHSLIGANMNRELGNRLLGSGCRVFNSDLAIQTDDASGILFPDASVICGPLQTTHDRSDIITNPVLVVEVLSPSSLQRDRGPKLLKYWGIPFLREYVIVEQSFPQVDVYSRQEEEWTMRSYQDLKDTIHLPNLGVTLPMQGVYADVSWPDA